MRLANIIIASFAVASIAMCSACDSDDSGEGTPDAAQISPDASPDASTANAGTCPGWPNTTYDGTLDAMSGTWFTDEMCTGSPMPAVQALCNGDVELSGVEQTTRNGVILISSEYRYVLNNVLTGQVTARFPSTCLTELGGSCAAAQTKVDGLLQSHFAQGTVACVDDAGGCRCTFDGNLRVLRAGALTSNTAGDATSHSFESGAVVTRDWNVASGSIKILHGADGEDDVQFSTAVDVSYDHALYCAAFMSTCNDVAGVSGYTDYDDCFTNSGTLTKAGSPQTTGDSFECRFHHVQIAVDATNAANRETHCPHAQFTATAPCAN